MSQTPERPYVASTYDARGRHQHMANLHFAAMRFRVWHTPITPQAKKTFRIQCNSLATAMGLVEVLELYGRFRFPHPHKLDAVSGIEYYDFAENEWVEFDPSLVLEEYRRAMLSPAVMGMSGAESQIPGWRLEPGEAMKVVEW